MKTQVQASAPGSLMLMGEHAVLHGKLALACAVSRRIQVRLVSRPDRRIHIHSDLGELEADLDRLPERAPFQFILTVLATWRRSLDLGFDLHVKSDFTDKVGLGSSAAVTVALHAALAAGLGKHMKPMELFQAGLRTIRHVQGLGSGADVAASVWGGVVAYRAQPLEIDPLPQRFPITVIYSGSKVKTPQVVRHVETARSGNPEVFEKIFELQEILAQQAVKIIGHKDAKGLGALFNIHQGLQDALGVSNEKLSSIVYALRSRRGILGAKISGSGLGDCVIGLGKADLRNSGYQVLDVEMSSEGVRHD